MAKKQKSEVPKATSVFLEIECKKCKKKHVVFSKVATEVDCDKCGEVMVQPTGGHSRVRAKILSILD